MAWTNLSHEIASKYAKRAQWAFGFAGVAAVAVAAMGTKPREEPALPPLEVPAAPVGSTTGTAEAEAPATVDTKAIATRLGMVGNHPKVAPKAEEPAGNDVPTTPVASETLKFLGVLREPGRLVALLKIGEKQKLLGPGEASGGVKVVEVSENRAVVTEGGVEKKLELQSRTGPTVTFIAGNPSPGGAQGFTPPMARPMGQSLNQNNQVPDPKSILERRERAMREAAEAQAAMEGEGRAARPKPVSGEKH